MTGNETCHMCIYCHEKGKGKNVVSVCFSIPPQHMGFDDEGDSVASRAAWVVGKDAHICHLFKPKLQ